MHIICLIVSTMIETMIVKFINTSNLIAPCSMFFCKASNSVILIVPDF